MRFPLLHLLAVALVALLFAAPVVAQEGMPSMPDMPVMPEAPNEMKPNNSMYGPAVPDTSRGPGFNFAIETGESSRQKLSTSVELVLFITLLTLAPAIVLSMTSFTRIIIVLSFMKRAMSIQEMPPSTVVTGLALFLSLFIMKPVYTAVYDDALSPTSKSRSASTKPANAPAGSCPSSCWARRATRISSSCIALPRRSHPSRLTTSRFI
jgi:flagellar biosynthesis protein FliP